MFLPLLLLAVAASTKAQLAVVANTNYTVVAGTSSTISILLTGDGLNNATLNASYSELTYTLYSISDMSTPIAEGFWTAYSDSLAATDAFIIDPASVQDGPVAIGLFRDVQVLLEPDASTPVAYLVHSLPDLHQSASPCLFDSDQEPQLVLAMQTGQTYVGQIVGANEWRYYEWVVEGEAPYVGNSYEIAVVFEQGQQPLGVFAKYTDIFSVHPPLYGYDPNMNACPVTDCDALSILPPSPSYTCGFDARVLSCDNVKLENGTAAIGTGLDCILNNQGPQSVFFSILTKHTRDGKYVIGVQGQGATPPPNVRSLLGYCSDCTGFTSPVEIVFSISIQVSAASTTVVVFRIAQLLAVALACLLMLQ